MRDDHSTPTPTSEHCEFEIAEFVDLAQRERERQADLFAGRLLRRLRRPRCARRSSPAKLGRRTPRRHRVARARTAASSPDGSSGGDPPPPDSRVLPRLVAIAGEA